MKRQKLYPLLKQLLRNCRRSDRELAKALESSQPTVTRMRNNLEREGYIKTYTVIPDFSKLEYEILAFTFSKMKTYPNQEEALKIMQNATKWVDERPNVIFAADGQGLGGKDVVMISLHRGYSEYADFMRNYAMDWSEIVSTFESFIVDVKSKFTMKPLDLKYLAKDKL
jgi:DNA-binding Lrp family transcriptional regulator